MYVVLIVLAVGFGFTNGLHDAANAIAAPIVTRALRPASAVGVAAVAHLAGALAVGTAVAATVAGIIHVPASDLTQVLGAAMVGALAWSLFTLSRGLPCSSGHCLVGALAGAALADGGPGRVHWGGLHGARPVGVVGSLFWLLVSAVFAAPLAGLGIRAARRVLRRATRAVLEPIRRGEVLTTAALAFAHGSNDAQKTMGLLALALVATGRQGGFGVPAWAVFLAATALTAGTALGGWRVVRTLGRGIYPVRTLEGVLSQGVASLIVLGSSLVGAPISTTDVVAPAVVGVGAGQRWRHVRWRVVGEIGAAWLVTLPMSGVLAAVSYVCWRAVS
jgi:PiT family inorganic phosphate transporter